MKTDYEEMRDRTKRFLLGETYDPTVLSSIQIIFEMLNGLRIVSQRESHDPLNPVWPVIITVLL